MMFETMEADIRIPEKMVLDRFSFRTGTHFSHFGLINDKLYDDLTAYFFELNNYQSDIDSSGMAGVVYGLARQVIADSGFKAMCLTIRTSEPNLIYKVPRWHIDVNHFESKRDQYKYVYTLVGPPTRFAIPIDQKEFFVVYDEYRSLAPHDFAGTAGLRYRKQLDFLVEEFTIGKCELACFSVGREKGVIHSEPDMLTPRIFLSMIPGKYHEVKTVKWKNAQKSVTSEQLQE